MTQRIAQRIKDVFTIAPHAVLEPGMPVTFNGEQVGHVVSVHVEQDKPVELQITDPVLAKYFKFDGDSYHVIPDDKGMPTLERRHV